MEFREVLLRRRSVRRFTDAPVSDDMIDTLLHAAMSGPSACNRTPWAFYVVTDPDRLRALRGATRFSNMDAPLAIVCCGDLARALPRHLARYWVQDVSAATENILLCATDLGLGAVWCGAYPTQREGEISPIVGMLGLPEEHVPMNIVWIGHPAEAPEPRDQYDAARVHYVK